MGAIFSYGLHDCTHLKIIPVISSFDKEGKITPLYVRLDEESFKVYNSYLSFENFKVLEFNCEIMVGNGVRPLKLTYHVGEHKWTTPIP